MPYQPQARESLPFYQPRYTPDLSRLAAITGRGGEQLAALSQQRGAITADALVRLSSIISGAYGGMREDKARQAATAARATERAEDKKFTAEEKRLEREERAAERKAAEEARKASEDRSAARWTADNTTADVPLSTATAAFLRRFPETAARLSEQTTLPARPLPMAAGEMSLEPMPTGNTMLRKSPDDVRADAQLTAQRERWAAEDARAAKDDTRADRALAATTANQALMARIAQQNADTSRMQAETTRQRYTGAGVDTSKMKPEFANALDRAILTIPATKRAPILALAHRLADEGDEKGLKEVIQQAAIENENVDAKNQIRGRQATIAALTDAQAVLQQMKAAGVPTNILTGTIEDVARKLGTSTDPRYVEFSNQLADALINYRRAATGVAFGEKEAAEYSRMFPNYRQTLPVNEAAIRGLKRAMETNDRTYWRGKLGEAGVKAIFGETAEQNPAGLKILSIVPVPKG